MKINKNGLDEMQIEKRNSIGNQMFTVMSYALLADSGLYAAGIHWLKYPSNIMVIIMVCMSIYLVRTILANAYQPPKAKSRKTVISLIIVLAFSVVFAIIASDLFRNLSAQSVAEDVNDNSAWILLVVSAAGLLISLIAAILKGVNDKNDNGD